MTLHYLKNHPLELPVDIIVPSAASVDPTLDEMTINSLSKCMLFSQISKIEINLKIAFESSFDAEISLQSDSTQSENTFQSSTQSGKRTISQTSNKPAKKSRTRLNLTSLLEELRNSGLPHEVSSGQHILALMMAHFPATELSDSSLLQNVEAWFFSTNQKESELASITLSRLVVPLKSVNEIVLHILSRLANSSAGSYHFLSLLESLIKHDLVSTQQLVVIFNQMVLLNAMNDQFAACFCRLLERIKPWSQKQLKLIMSFIWRLENGPNLDKLLLSISPILGSELKCCTYVSTPILEEKSLFELKFLNINRQLQLCANSGDNLYKLLFRQPDTAIIVPWVSGKKLHFFLEMFLNEVEDFSIKYPLPTPDFHFQHAIKNLWLLQLFSSSQEIAIANDEATLRKISEYMSPLIKNFSQINVPNSFSYIKLISKTKFHLFWPLSTSITKKLAIHILQTQNISTLNQKIKKQRKVNLLEISTYQACIDINKAEKLDMTLASISILLSRVGKLDINDETLSDLIHIAFTHVLESCIPVQLNILSGHISILNTMMDKYSAIVPEMFKIIFDKLETYKTERNVNLWSFCILYIRECHLAGVLKDLTYRKKTSLILKFLIDGIKAQQMEPTMRCQMVDLLELLSPDWSDVIYYVIVGN